MLNVIEITSLHFAQSSIDYSAIVTPSCAGEAPKKEEFNAETRFCGLWTALHVPVISVPGFAGSNGLPIGLSFVGARQVPPEVRELS